MGEEYQLPQEPSSQDVKAANAFPRNPNPRMPINSVFSFIVLVSLCLSWSDVHFQRNAYHLPSFDLDFTS